LIFESLLIGIADRLIYLVIRRTSPNHANKSPIGNRPIDKQSKIKDP